MIWTILKLILVLVVAYLVIAIFSASRILKKRRQEMMADYEEKQQKYAHLTTELIEAIPDDKLHEAIMIHLFQKEDEDFEHLKDRLTESERVIYTLYQMEISVDEGRGSVYHFFTGPSKEYLPYLSDSFQAVGSEALKELMDKIIALVIQEQSGQYEADQLDEDAPTFEGYTFDYLDLVKSEQLDDKIVRFIRSHQADFAN